MRLEDFEVFLNTDLVVWLSEAAAPASSEEAVNAPHVEIAALESTMGPQNHLVPADLPIEQVRSVIVWCPPIRSAYLAATLTPSYHRPAAMDVVMSLDPDVIPVSAEVLPHHPPPHQPGHDAAPHPPRGRRRAGRLGLGHPICPDPRPRRPGWGE